MTRLKDYKRSRAGYAQWFQDATRADAETPVDAEQTPIAIIEGMTTGRAQETDDIKPEDRPIFERTEWETKTEGLVMEKVGATHSTDPKVGHAVIPALAASVEDWERHASATDADYEKQRLVDYGRQLVMTGVRERREARRKYEREQLLAALQS